MDVKPTLTVFTPAYNRAHTIGRTYESLCRQTCKDFEWLIIDDGSTDNTRDLIKGWIMENRIPIRYIYQTNQGMHGAHNTAYENITTELNTCIDSDDWMPDDAVEQIVTFWKEKGSNKYAGIIGLDVTKNGKLISTPFPGNMKATTLVEYEQTVGNGDSKMVLRTDVAQKYLPYPMFAGEKYFSLGYLYLLIDQDYECLTLNKPLVIVDYQEDGSSMGMWKQYWNNPKGFAFLRKEHMRLYKRRKYRIMSCIHYASHCFRCKSYNEFLKTPFPLLSLFAIPFGFALYLITYYNVRKGNKLQIIIK